MILTLSTSCSSRLEVTQQRELKRYYRLLPNQFTRRKTRSSHRKTQAEYQSSQISNVHTANARPHFNIYQRMLQGGGELNPNTKFTRSSTHISIFHRTRPFLHISFPTPQNSVAKSSRHLFISTKISPEPLLQRSVFTSRRSSYQNKFT